jgi:hypothetical protein
MQVVADGRGPADVRQNADNACIGKAASAGELIHKAGIRLRQRGLGQGDGFGGGLLASTHALEQLLLFLAVEHLRGGAEPAERLRGVEHHFDQAERKAALIGDALLTVPAPNEGKRRE